ncbi:MAG: GGDEF domain-containing protein [Pseudomonadota bacterium]
MANTEILNLRKKSPQPAAKWLSNGDDIFSYLENDRERFIPSMDLLTGLSNKIGFFENLKKEVDRTNRKLSTGGVIISIDLDNFADLQQRFGPKTRETSLKLISKTLVNHIRLMDTAARFHDDNFLILMPDALGDEALRHAESLVRKLNNLSFIMNGEEINIRTSLGIVEFKPGDHLHDVWRKTGIAMA